jgi:hypothetical protein
MEWNTKTVTLPPPFEKARPRALYSVILQLYYRFYSFFPISSRIATIPFLLPSHMTCYLVCQAALKGGIPSPRAALTFKL